MSDDQSNIIEQNLAQFVSCFHDKMRRDAKYRNFNQILKVFATSSTYQKKFRNFRMYFLVIMLAGKEPIDDVLYQNVFVFH